MTWPVWGQLRRPGDLEKQRAWSQFPSPCQPLPAGPTPAPTERHPSAKEQELSLFSFQLNPCQREVSTGMCTSYLEKEMATHSITLEQNHL